MCNDASMLKLNAMAKGWSGKILCMLAKRRKITLIHRVRQQPNEWADPSHACERRHNKRNENEPERERWVIAIAARQIQSTDFQTQKYLALCFHFQELGAQHFTCTHTRVPVVVFRLLMRHHEPRRSWWRSISSSSSIIKKRRRNRAKRKWFMTFHMKQNTHSKCLFIWCTRETTQHKYFYPLEDAFFFFRLFMQQHWKQTGNGKKTKSKHTNTWKIRKTNSNSCVLSVDNSCVCALCAVP